MPHICRLFTALALGTAVALSACASAPRSAGLVTGAQVALTEPTTLRIAIDHSRPDLDQIIRAFEARNSGLCVVQVTGDASWRLATGEADLVATSAIDMRQALEQRQLLPLDPFLDAARLDLAAYGNIAADGRWNGHTYELPLTASPYVILYNQRHFDRAGLPVPPPWWNWEDFRQVVTTLAGKALPGEWAFSEDAVPPGTVPVTFAEDRTGGKPVDPDAAAAALDFWSGLLAVERGAASESGGRWVEFLAGRGAMLLTPLDGRRVSELGAAGFAWGVLALPEAKGGPGAVKVGRPLTYAIAARSAHPDLAWKFLQFAAGPVAAGLWANAGAFPARRTEDSRQTWRERLPANPGREWLLEREWAVMFTRTRGDLAEKARDALAGAVAAVPPGQDLRGAAVRFQVQYQQLTAVTQ